MTDSISKATLVDSTKLIQALMKERNERREQLRKDLTAALNRNSAEMESGTPDFILADMLISHLDAYNHAIQERRGWYGIDSKETV